MARSVCKVLECGKPSHARGLCSMHYCRSIRGYQGKSPRLGRRVSHEEIAAFIAEAIQHDREACLLWPFGRAKAGYGTGWYKGRQIPMHRLICELTHGPAPSSKYEAAHACGNAACVAPRHLRWATRAENVADRLLHGTHNRGERHGASKLTREDVLTIRAQSHRKLKELAAEYGVSISRISGIRNRREWAWLEDER